GLVSPDTFIVDKVSGKVLEKKTGTKESSIWLSPNGGTTEDASKRGDTLTLTDGDLQRLTDMLVKVEDYYNRPIDIEWAFSDGRLYLLQARPITAYIPLPEEMITEPGEQKRLYLDVTLSKQGIQEPMSHMGIDYLSSIQTVLFRELLGTTGLMGVDKLYFSCEGRMYENIMNSYKILGRKRTLNDWRTQDAIAADIIENMDEREYALKRSPRGLGRVKINIFLSGLGIFRKLRGTYKDHVSYKDLYYKETERYMKDLDEIKKMDIPSKEVAKRTIERFVTFLVDVTLPMTYAAEYSRLNIRKIFKGESEETKEKVVFLERALPENITLEMGLEMYRLSEFSEVSECTSGEEFERKISERSFSQEFLGAYDSFMEKYGFRCPRELDLATPRTYENPAEFFEQLHAMSLNKDEETNPQSIYEKSVKERQEAFEELMQVAEKRGRRKARGLKKNYDVLVEFGGYREIHKYYFIMIIDLFRRRVLEVAKELEEAGSIDRVEDVFDLEIDDLEEGVDGSSIDLRAIMEENTRYLKKVEHIREFPRLIDSRGKILRPPRKESREGELVGEMISPGIVRGKVKVLERPDEKPLLPGEILVARATDPGWTPLFINAAGVILEVGGLLQHGALVAREYGRPCIAGIEDATSLLKDGQEIEMDGASGVVKILGS
ncbi:MAG: PEP-utilizing enzyme, partial [Halobacteriota archaeon]|nr:PEP-utilizing enzyme [Halobacteriota archaeon]